MAFDDKHLEAAYAAWLSSVTSDTTAKGMEVKASLLSRGAFSMHAAAPAVRDLREVLARMVGIYRDGVDEASEPDVIKDAMARLRETEYL